MSHLHAFHLWLCNYVRLNVSQLCDDQKFHERLQQVDQRLIEHLDVSGEYFKYDELITPIKDKLPDAEKLAKAKGMQPPLLLNGDEFQKLEILSKSLPIEMTRNWDRPQWESLPPTHQRAINCIREIADRLSNSEADKWSRTSERLAKELEQRPLQLEDGVKAIHAWSREICRLLHAMGKYSYVPRPKGSHPTPTTLEISGPLRENEPQPPPEASEDDIARVTKAVREKRGEGGTDAKPDVIRAQASMNKQKCGKILRYLEERDEYNGFRASKAE